jgi:3',5'-cyclic AMP phosphodiesterase CpdA
MKIPVVLGGTLGSFAVVVAAGIQGVQQPAPLPSFVEVRRIAPPRTPLPPESQSAGQQRFSFIAYGDARTSVDRAVPELDHERVVDAMVAKIGSLATSTFPVRFVLQTGDAVYNGSRGDQLNVGFSPLVEKITRGANVPYFMTAGNHDVGPAGGPELRSIGLHNTLSALSGLIPPEGSPRRLNGYLTYAFGYGNLFGIAIDSNVAADRVQLAWVADQLEHLDRSRYRHVIAFFHHPMFSSGPHGGVTPGPNGPSTDDNVERQTAFIRSLYTPLFRRFHVRMTIAGHDHLLDHFVERYTDEAKEYRRDDVVTGGGGAPSYQYRGEPEIQRYLAANAENRVRVEHIMKPGLTPDANPHHFVVIQVDGDHLSLEVFGVGSAPLTPYNGQSRLVLD